MLQVNPQFHLYVPHVDDFGLVIFVTDYHTEEHLYWTLAMEKTGEIWTLSNDKVRACKNPTIGRLLPGTNSPAIREPEWTEIPEHHWKRP